jgi:hypothetical protein
MSDLVKRLYETPLYYGHGEASALGEQAADEITRLTKEVERLKSGYQGACYACEPVGELNLKLTARVKELEGVLQQIAKRADYQLPKAQDIARAALSQPVEENPNG